MKWFAAALVIAILGMQYRMWLSDDGWREVARLQSSVDKQSAENQRLTARNTQLRAEVRDLKQGFVALEERARSELGMISGNETFFPGGAGEEGQRRSACRPAAEAHRRRPLTFRYLLIVPAAGSGARFGGDVPKQYAPLASRTVLECSLAPFLEDARCALVMLALDAADRHWPGIAARLPARQRARVRTTAGGARRSESVRNALRALETAPADSVQPPPGGGDWVLVHDAARPCVTREEVDRLCAQLAAEPVGGLLATPVTDTIKQGEAAGGLARSTATLDRSHLWRALTPQMFRLGALRDALDQAHAAGRFPTDDAQALEWAGERPVLVPGSADNVKVTTRADLDLAAALLAQRRAPRPAAEPGAAAQSGGRS